MNFRSDINGLRAIAVSVVVLFHFAIPGFQGGFVGVDVFYVISGYLMTGIIFSKLDKTSFYIADFYLDRAKRIVPALAVLCISLLVVGWFLLLPNQYEMLGKHTAGSMFFVSNIIYLRESGYFDVSSHAKWLLHTWSLSVEWQFYIIYPLLVVFLKRLFNDYVLKKCLIGVTIISFLLSTFLVSEYPEKTFYLLPTRAWEILAGGFIYLYPIKLSTIQAKVLEVSGLAMIIISAFYFSSNDLWPGYLALLPVTGTLMVIAADNQNSMLTNNKLFQWLGKISYSLYLWHWPIVVFITYIGVKSENLYVAVGISISVFLGYLSCRYIEKNTHHLKYNKGSKKLTQTLRNNVFRYVFVLVAFVFALSSYIKINDGVESRLPVNVLKISREADNKNPRSKQCNVYPGSGLESPQCIYGNSRNIATVVIGDSHSASVITAIEKSLEEISGGAIFLGADGCSSLMNTTSWYFKECNKYNEWLTTYISDNQQLHDLPVIIINRTTGLLKGDGVNTRGDYYVAGVKMGDDGYSKVFSDEYSRVICGVRKTNPVYIVKPIAEMPFIVPERLAKTELLSLPLDAEGLNISAYYERHRETLAIMNSVKKSCGAVLLDPLPYLCSDDLCPAAINGRPLYHDDDHLSEYGNKFLVPMFKKIWD